MPGSHAHHDSPSRFVGIATFLGGIAMLVLVFTLAYHLLIQPVPGLNLSNPPQGVPPPAASIGLALGAFGEKLLLLALLTLVGSLVANKGIHLVYAAAHGSGLDAASAPSQNGTGPLPAAAPAPSQPAPPP